MNSREYIVRANTFMHHGVRYQQGQTLPSEPLNAEWLASKGAITIVEKAPEKKVPDSPTSKRTRKKTRG